MCVIDTRVAPHITEFFLDPWIFINRAAEAGESNDLVKSLRHGKYTTWFVQEMFVEDVAH